MTSASVRHGIVAGIDGSPGAVNAARWAASAARKFDEPLRLTHVLPGQPDFSEGGAVTDEEMFDRHIRIEGAKFVEEAENAIRDDHTDVTIERAFVAGTPATALVELSKTARILSLGQAGTTEMQSVFLGSDTIRVVNRAHCPVTVFRGSSDHATTDTRPIVVGIDGSKLSELATGHAFEFAAFLGVPLVAVHTWNEHASLGGYSEARRFTDWGPYEEHENALLSECLAGWTEKYPEVEVTRSVQRSGPMKALLEHSAEAQLVVVGSHGRSPFMASIVGSTSQSLIHHAQCPVMVCREG
ncbi:universal stress protein [Rhodococcus sp. KBS0724]|jgi:nucleotide-binding universal stress UspA family protein|uniref:universal stress protein n=1 Tax=Rhodococcus sp. KBS0724 TaxID=1179674 RepID=UPI00110F0A8C|nr:universal stress protein [Rhodococcus sp. KBS0724]TSD46530.1 universal stress protein [Rhodococcus sp. KBS0724]